MSMDTDDCSSRMLENPQDDTVVRWGDGGDSFVVLEVGSQHRLGAHPVALS